MPDEEALLITQAQTGKLMEDPMFTGHFFAGWPGGDSTNQEVPTPGGSQAPNQQGGSVEGGADQGNPGPSADTQDTTQEADDMAEEGATSAIDTGDKDIQKHMRDRLTDVLLKAIKKGYPNDQTLGLGEKGMANQPLSPRENL